MLNVAAHRLVTLAVMACLVSEAHALDPHRNFPQYVREKWSAANGLPGGAVHAIAQSPDGYLWIGTDKGLVRFDGFTFLPVPPKSLLPQNDPILGLTTDAEGDLWVRMQTAGILRYNRGKFENLASGPNATVTQVTAIARESVAGMLLSDLISGTLRLRRGKLDLVAPATILPGAAVTSSMAETAGGNIWLGTLGAGLFYLENGRVTRVTQGLTETKINCLLLVGEQELWVGTDHGLFRWSGTGFRRTELGPSLRDQQVLTILRDRDANIWVGTTRGLLRVNASGTSLAEEEGMQRAGAVNALFEDREGNLWVGGATGLERIRDSAFITYSTDKGPSPYASGPVYVDGEDRTWFAPEKGGLYWIKNGHIHAVKPALLGKDVIYSIAGRDHEIWIGRRQGGLTHLRYSSGPITTETYGQANGLEQNSVYATYQGRDGAVWAGTLTGGVSRLKDGKFTIYTTTNGLASNTVSSILEGHDGTIWFGTPNGLSALANGKWRTYSLQDGLPSDNVNCLFEDSAGALWIGTSAGLAYFQMGQMHTLQEVPESLREQIVGMAEDKSRRFWIATSNHVLRVPHDKLQSGVVTAVDAREYGQADGLESTEGVNRSQSVVSDSAGRIWFSLSGGLSVVDPSQLTDNSVRALPHIEAITADNNTANLDASVRIPPSPRRITFEYTGLSLAVPGRIRFRYFLEGFDSSWSQPVAAREAVYTNLGPGSYRFRLVASNSEGLWNGPETAIALNVAPAYYQTYWFRLSCIAVFIALLWALHRWRIYHLRGQEKRLRDVVETIPAMTFTTLADGSFTFVNKRWTEYTGLSVEETSGIGWQRALHREDLARHSGKWRISVATGQLFEDEARFRTAADGEYRWFLVRGVPLRDPHGKIAQWYGTLTDIEERKRAEQEREKLRQLEDDLSHINRVSMLGEMAASLAHEIKQPIAAAMTSANSCIEWLAHEPPNLDRARAAAAKIDKYGNRAAEIIDHIRSLYRKSPPQSELIDVNEIVHEIFTLLQGEAIRYSIAMRSELADELPHVEADRVQLQQVFMNLMLNAIEAMRDEGGELTVKSQRQDGQLLFSVRDTGPGLPVGNVDQIFSAFFTTKPQGSGMGLAISRTIVESHGGRLWTTANDGRGATFYFTLPTEVRESSPQIAQVFWRS
jgi:PAS domain S-box-containing protein